MGSKGLQSQQKRGPREITKMEYVQVGEELWETQIPRTITGFGFELFLLLFLMFPSKFSTDRCIYTWVA